MDARTAMGSAAPVVLMVVFLSLQPVASSGYSFLPVGAPSLPDKPRTCDEILLPCQAVYSQCSVMRERFLRTLHHGTSPPVRIPNLTLSVTGDNINMVLLSAALALAAAAVAARRGQATARRRIQQLEDELTYQKRALMCSIAESAHYAELLMEAKLAMEATNTAGAAGTPGSSTAKCLPAAKHHQAPTCGLTKEDMDDVSPSKRGASDQKQPHLLPHASSPPAQRSLDAALASCGGGSGAAAGDATLALPGECDEAGQQQQQQPGHHGSATVGDEWLRTVVSGCEAGMEQGARLQEGGVQCSSASGAVATEASADAIAQRLVQDLAAYNRHLKSQGKPELVMTLELASSALAPAAAGDAGYCLAGGAGPAALPLPGAAEGMPAAVGGEQAAALQLSTAQVVSPAAAPLAQPADIMVMQQQVKARLLQAQQEFDAVQLAVHGGAATPTQSPWFAKTPVSCGSSLLSDLAKFSPGGGAAASPAQSSLSMLSPITAAPAAAAAALAAASASAAAGGGGLPYVTHNELALTLKNIELEKNVKAMQEELDTVRIEKGAAATPNGGGTSPSNSRRASGMAAAASDGEAAVAVGAAAVAVQGLSPLPGFLAQDLSYVNCERGGRLPLPLGQNGGAVGNDALRRQYQQWNEEDGDAGGADDPCGALAAFGAGGEAFEFSGMTTAGPAPASTGRSVGASASIGGSPQQLVSPRRPHPANLPRSSLPASPLNGSAARSPSASAASGGGGGGARSGECGAVAKPSETLLEVGLNLSQIAERMRGLPRLSRSPRTHQATPAVATPAPPSPDNMPSGDKNRGLGV